MLQTKVCKTCQNNFPIEDADTLFYEKIGVPSPSLCPLCRRRRRLNFRNERKLYRRTCDACHKSMVSVYREQAPFPVYCPACWWSDTWNASIFCRNYDSSRSFFEQWNELNKLVPHISLWQIQNQNCEFSHDTSYNKNCYMLFGADYNQDVYYSVSVIKDKDCCDCFTVYESERMYECTDCITCQFCKYSQLLRNCSTSDFSFDLHNCHFCFGCTGLRNKSYCWFNKEIGKEEFMRRYNALVWTWPEIWENIQKSFQASLSTPRRASVFRNCEESTGNYLGNCKNARVAFDAENCRDIAHSLLVVDSKDVFDSDIIYYNVEIAYESQTLIRNCQRVFFSYFLRDSKNTWYSNECYMSSDLFGCVGLRSAKNSILNKSYSPEEYKTLTAQIQNDMKTRGELGEFFPVSMSPFGFNETCAQDYADPLTQDQAVALGYSWAEDLEKASQSQTYQVPEKIGDVPESIIHETLTCGRCYKNFRIAPQEYKFNKEMKVPIPSSCFDCRHTARIRRRGPRTLFNRTCSKCSAPIQTTYAPGRPETTYCEKCYLESVY